MNKRLKKILIAINFLMLLLAVLWQLGILEAEPIIIAFGQIGVLIGLFFEKDVSKIITKRIANNSAIEIDVEAGGNVKTSDVDNSTVKVKTRN